MVQWINVGIAWSVPLSLLWDYQSFCIDLAQHKQKKICTLSSCLESASTESTFKLKM